MWLGEEDTDTPDTIIVQMAAGEDSLRQRIEQGLTNAFALNQKAVVQGHQAGRTTLNVLIAAPPHEYAWQGKLGDPVLEIVQTWLKHLKLPGKVRIILRTGSHYKLISPRQGDFERI